MRECGDKRCGTCSNDNFKYLESGSHIKFNNGSTFKINADMNCKTQNLIYCITCLSCKENYIGETNNSLCQRTRIHRQHIRQEEYRKIPLSKHLEVCSGGTFKIFPFYKCKRIDSQFRKTMEQYFIKKFSPKLNV